jgi:hypothetical protein
MVPTNDGNFQKKEDAGMRVAGGKRGNAALGPQMGRNTAVADPDLLHSTAVMEG